MSSARGAPATTECAASRRRSREELLALVAAEGPVWRSPARSAAPRTDGALAVDVATHANGLRRVLRSLRCAATSASGRRHHHLDRLALVHRAVPVRHLVEADEAVE